MRRVEHWAGWPVSRSPAAALPGRSLGEAGPGLECCGRLRDAAPGGHGANMVPTQELLRGGSRQWSSWAPHGDKRVFVSTEVQVLLFSPTSLRFDSCYSLVRVTLPAKVYTGTGDVIS